MSQHRITITPGEPKPGFARIELDGHDIGNAVTHASVRFRPGDLPNVTLGLAAELGPIDGDAQVWLPPETREALIALGWTPPAQPESEAK